MARASSGGSRRRGAAATRSLAVYVALVGAPLVGLVWILGVGERLVPPPHLGGRWRLEGGSEGLPRVGCPGLHLSTGTTFEISQSGRWSVLVFDDAQRTTVRARLEDTLLVGRVPPASASPCGAEAILRLRVGSRGGEDHLTGALSAPGCAGCQPVPVRAVRGSARGER